LSSLATTYNGSQLARCDVVSARCCCLASEPQEDCYLSTPISAAVQHYVDLLFECGEWLASVQTDKLARSSLLLHR